MEFEIKLYSGVVKAINKLDAEIKKRILKGIKTLSNGPFQSRSGADIKRLKGTRKRQDLFRLRIGDYRVIYAVENKTIWITEIFHRSRGYDWLE